MKATGIIRKVDELGRIVLPIELRRNLDIAERDELEIYVDGDNVILHKHEASCIFCGSIYGDTMNVSEILASTLADDGVRGIALYDVSKTDTSRMVAEAFRYSTLVFSSVTYNNRVFPPMGELIDDIAALGLRNRSYAVIENGTWAPSAGDKIDSVLSSLKGFEPIAERITIRSAPTEIDAEIVRCLGHKISRRILH